MSSLYPAQIDSSSTLPVLVDNASNVTADSVNILRDAIIKIEAELGLKPSNLYNTVRLRLDTLETMIGAIPSITFAGDLSGTNSSQTVIGLQGRLVSNAAPTLSQVLSWNGITWAPSTINSVSKITTSYSVNSSDGVISVGTTISGINITLPLSPVAGKEIIIKDAVGLCATNNITVLGNGKTIDGASSFVMNTNYKALNLIFDGTTWMVV
jgi:hypothetical protein